MEVLRQNAEHADNHKITFNGNIIFEIPDLSYKNVDIKKVCSCS